MCKAAAPCESKLIFIRYVDFHNFPCQDTLNLKPSPHQEFHIQTNHLYYSRQTHLRTTERNKTLAAISTRLQTIKNVATRTDPSAKE